MKLLLLILTTLSAHAQFGAPTDTAFWRQANSPYLADNAVFDGFTQYMFKQATYGGAVTDSPGFTLSCWVKRGTNDGAGNLILCFANASSIDRCNIDINANNRVHVSALNSSSALLLDMVGTNTIKVTNGWTHIMVLANLNAGITNSKIYVNGVLDATNAQTRIAGTIDLTGTNYRYWIGRYTSAAAFWNGALSELWFDLNFIDDPTKFFNNGCPVYLGENGELPRGGTQPAWYFKGSGNLFNVVLSRFSVGELRHHQRAFDHDQPNLFVKKLWLKTFLIASAIFAAAALVWWLRQIPALWI